jgi:phage tail sheath gpL-like
MLLTRRKKIVLPTWCDNTHIVYAGNREQEFVDRINGMTYEEIANRGGGILNSAKKLNESSEKRFTNNQNDSRMSCVWVQERSKLSQIWATFEGEKYFV